MSVEQRGSTYRARIRDAQGRQIQRSFTRKVDAIRWEREQRASLDRGDFIDPTAGQITFAAYCADWLRHQAAGRRESTVAQVESRLRHHVLPVIGSMPLARIRRSDAQEVVTRAAATLSPGTVRVVRTAMRAVLQSAVDDRLIPSNPALRLVVASVDQRVVVLADHQVAEIIEAMEEPWKTMAIVASSTGMRSAELRALRLDSLAPRLHLAGDVSPTQCTITVDASVTTKRTLGPTKTAGSTRTIAVGRSVVDALRQHLATHAVGGNGLIFTAADGGALSSSMASEAWRKATAGMDLAPRCGFHSLRHFHASQLLSAGIGVPAVAARLGHANPAITLKVYSHVMAGDEARILDVTEALATRHG